MKLEPYDFSLLVFLVAAAIGHFRVSREKPEHVGIFVALIAAIMANLGNLALFPAHGLLPILFSLAVPGACLYGVCATHGFRVRRTAAFVVVGALGAWTTSLASPAHYAWVLLFAWCVIATLAWVCLLDPEERATGITRASAVALAASLLADLPGVFTWAKTESWKAESVLTSLSVTILATLPALWKLRTSGQSSSDSRCSRSDSSSGESPGKIQTRSE
jgi:hypothetical protein